MTAAPFPRLTGREPCRTGDPERFHPVQGSPAATQRVKEEDCGNCPIRDACLAYALTHQVSGIWGGTSDEERADYRREHGIRAVPVRLPVIDTELILRADRRGMPTEVIAALAGVEPHRVRHIIRAKAAS